MRNTIFLLLITLAFLTSCTTGVSVSTDHQPDFDFSNLQKYRWRDANQFYTDSVEYLNNDIIDGRIKAAVDAELKSHAYTLTPSGPVDFLVSYSVTTKEKADVRNYNTYGGMAPGFGYGSYYGRGYRYGGVGLNYQSEVDVVYYKEGTLVLDVVSADTDKLIWRASAEGKLHKNKTTEERQAILGEAVAKMLERFPPTPDS